MEQNIQQRIILKPNQGRGSSRGMKQDRTTEIQAVMNLLYIGDDEEGSALQQTLPRRDYGVLKDQSHKIKSNTLHLRTSKNHFATINQRTQSLEHSREYTKHCSENKENLKRILQKLESSPSPPAKRRELSRPREGWRLDTQKSEPNSKGRAGSRENGSVAMSKQSLDRLFDKKKEKSFIKSLIKAKIVEKLKRIESKKTWSKMETLAAFSQLHPRKPRPSVLRSSKSRELKSNFMQLLREERTLNNPVLSRKSSKLTMKQLLM